ncbi:TetR/AcrR family transcriptional regulator [Demequina pelophila]|uniref:TetR/AcrR family transcriptional regulator n=1 Tax=Demequina pelophila TaxID=1638984 RepID=UPI00078496C2|nr:TetR/AcrR family transcriptional regulator [Demequina pelophila]
MPSATSARARILEAARFLFYSYGIRGVGVDRVVGAADVAKATLYSHFSSKDHLVEAYLDEVDRWWRGRLREAAEAAGPTPADRLVGMFDAVGRLCEAGYFRGCAFINAAAEVDPDSRAHARIVRHKEDVRDWMRGLAAQAGVDDPDRIAASLSALLDGALAAGAVDPGTRRADAVKATARLLVTVAVPARV